MPFWKKSFIILPLLVASFMMTSGAALSDEAVKSPLTPRVVHVDRSILFAAIGLFQCKVKGGMSLPGLIDDQGNWIQDILRPLAVYSRNQTSYFVQSPPVEAKAVPDSVSFTKIQTQELKFYKLNMKGLNVPTVQAEGGANGDGRFSGRASFLSLPVPLEVREALSTEGRRVLAHDMNFELVQAGAGDGPHLAILQASLSRHCWAAEYRPTGELRQGGESY